MKLDLLVFAAHPDDAELACSGTILHQKSLGYKIGVIDLTQGELGTRGTAETRKNEAEASTAILSLDVRENLQLRDGFFEVEERALLKIVEVIRKYQPSTVFANAPTDRHPDHGRGSALVKRACFLAGLAKIQTGQYEKWRPDNLYYYIQDDYIEPDFVVDVTSHWSTKMKSVSAFSTQFLNKNSNEPTTPISSEDFWHFLDARGREMGRKIGVTYGEGFIADRMLSVKDVMSF